MSSFNFASCIFLPLSKYTVNMKTKSGYNYKIILASVLFIVITAVKLLFPAQTEDLRARLREVVSRDADYTAVFESLGEKLSGGAEWAAAFLLGQDETRAASAPVVYEPVTLDDLRREAGYLIAESPEPGETVSPTPTPTPTPTPEPAVTETPEAVAAFLEAQAQFPDYAVPSNVSYEMPRLPFEFESPVSGYTSSGFGYRLHPLQNEVKFHYGTDFAVYSGTDVHAFADGVVALMGWDDGYGNYVIIEHQNGWQTLYAHCSEVLVYSGQSVSRGDVIAKSGATGEVTGPHLHFEMRKDGTFYNPEFWLA